MITTKDLQRGDLVLLRDSGWQAYVVSRPRGIRVKLHVLGLFREIGDVYIWQVRGRIMKAEDKSRHWEPLQLTQDQENKRQKVAAFF